MQIGDQAATDSRALVSVVVPVYNEARVLPELIRRLRDVSQRLHTYQFEFVLVDDGSADDGVATARLLASQDSSVRVVQLRRNYGQTAALQTGFDAAAGDIVISMDADLQHFPEDIPRLLEKLEEGYDVVCGWRRTRREGIDRRWPSQVANWMVRRATRLSIHDIGTTFRAYRADVLHDFRLLGEHHRFVPVFARQAGARIAEVEIQNVGRMVGKSNYGLSRTFNVLLDLIFIFFYARYLDRPIRFFGTLGMAIIGAATLIGLALLYVYLVHNVPVVRDHSGWFTLALVMYLGGIQFILVGILSELLVRMYFDQKRASPYRVRVSAVDARPGERAAPQTEERPARHVTSGSVVR